MADDFFYLSSDEEKSFKSETLKRFKSLSLTEIQQLGSNENSQNKLLPFSVDPDKIFRPLNQKSTSNPMKSICLLFHDEFRYGSGVAISPYHILTAGHVIEDFRNTEEFEPFIYQNLHDEKREDREDFTLKVKHWVHPNWEQYADDQYDIAVIETVSPLKTHADFIQNTKLPFSLNEIYTVGHPARNYEKMYLGFGHVVGYQNNVIGHTANAESGMSGCPLISSRKHNGHQSTIVGIHAKGFESPAGGFNGDINKGIYFTDEIFNWVNNIIHMESYNEIS